MECYIGVLEYETLNTEYETPSQKVCCSDFLRDYYHLARHTKVLSTQYAEYRDTAKESQGDAPIEFFIGPLKVSSTDPST